jgi:hypothetical protein
MEELEHVRDNPLYTHRQLSASVPPDIYRQHECKRYHPVSEGTQTDPEWKQADALLGWIASAPENSGCRSESSCVYFSYTRIVSKKRKKCP